MLWYGHPEKNKEEDGVWQDITPAKHAIPPAITIEEIKPDKEEFVHAESWNPVRPASFGLQTASADVIVALKWSDAKESDRTFGKKFPVRLMMDLDACHATPHQCRIFANFVTATLRQARKHMVSSSVPIPTEIGNS